MVDAKRIKTWDDDDTGTNVDSWVYAVYTYEVNGKAYKYKYMDRTPLNCIILTIPARRSSVKNKWSFFAFALYYTYCCGCNCYQFARRSLTAAKKTLQAAASEFPSLAAALFDVY